MKKVLTFLGVWVVFVTAVILTQVAIAHFIVATCRIQGDSMLPTYRNGDVVLSESYLLRVRDPRKGEIVVFRDRDGYIVIKRIARVPGEWDDISPSTPRILGSNEYVVLGDNAEVSLDSRYYGTIVKDQMLGIVK